jgi:hypothetical protein
MTDEAAPAAWVRLELASVAGEAAPACPSRRSGHTLTVAARDAGGSKAAWLFGGLCAPAAGASAAQQLGGGGVGGGGPSAELWALDLASSGAWEVARRAATGRPRRASSATLARTALARPSRPRPHPCSAVLAARRVERWRGVAVGALAPHVHRAARCWRGGRRARVSPAALWRHRRRRGRAPERRLAV